MFEILVTNQSGVALTLNQPNQSVQVTSAFTPPQAIQLTPAQVEQRFGGVLETLPPSPLAQQEDDDEPAAAEEVVVEEAVADTSATEEVEATEALDEEEEDSEQGLGSTFETNVDSFKESSESAQHFA